MSLTASDLTTYNAFAEQLAGAAAAQALPLFRAVVGIDNKLGETGFDPVTEADRNAEKAMRDIIETTYPDHGIVGEEWGTKDSQGNMTWVLDPIDGTRSFIAGAPLWTTLIGLCESTNPVLGLIDQSFIGERFGGINAAGHCKAWYEHAGSKTEIFTSQCRRLSDAIMTCTTPEMYTEPELVAYRQVESTTKLTRYSMDAYGYGLLAMGRLDLVVESDLKPYDIQPLIPVVQGAGGMITYWRGECATKGGQVIAAATPELHAEAMALLQHAAI